MLVTEKTKISGAREVQFQPALYLSSPPPSLLMHARLLMGCISFLAFVTGYSYSSVH